MGVKGVFLLSEALNGRDGHEVGRELLARLYRQATGEKLPPIAVTPRGKPFFSDGAWHFSISHTKHFAFCALSRNNIGLDAEEKGRAVSPVMMEKFTSDGEKSRLGDDSQDAFLRLWVLKEADAKLTGRGMGNWLKDTDFDPFDPRIQEINGCYVAVLEEE
jgi:phosphopantetheinyl transferase